MIGEFDIKVNLLEKNSKNSPKNLKPGIITQKLQK